MILTLAILTTACGTTDHQELQTEDTEKKAPKVTAKAVQSLVQNHVALVLWTEATRLIVDNHRGQSLKIPMSKPNAHCADQLEAASRATPSTMPKQFVECALQAVLSQPPPAWDKLSPVEKEARVNAGLNRITEAYNPVTLASQILALEQDQMKYHHHRSNVQSIDHNFTQCLSESNPSHREINTDDHLTFAKTWKQALNITETCAETARTTKR